MAQAKKETTQEVTGYVKVAEVAKTLDMTPQWVRDLTKKGVLKTHTVAPGERYFLPETIKAYVNYLRELANSKTKPADTVKAEADKLRAEADLKQSKAKIAEMQLKELEGKMHRSEDVEAATNDLVYTTRSMIMALPGRLAMDVMQAKTAAEASAIIRAECYKILNELAGYKYDPEAYKRRVRDREGWSEALADEADD